MKGKVKFFSSTKGYGFIESAECEGDIFVHFQAIQGDGFKTLEQGQNVEFDLSNTDKGSQASNVRKI